MKKFTVPSDAQIGKRTQVGGDHYLKCPIQPIEYIVQNGLGWCEGNAVKFITRWKLKGGILDLEKARDYIDRLIAMEKAKL